MARRTATCRTLFLIGTRTQSRFLGRHNCLPRLSWCDPYDYSHQARRTTANSLSVWHSLCRFRVHNPRCLFIAKNHTPAAEDRARAQNSARVPIRSGADPATVAPYAAIRATSGMRYQHLFLLWRGKPIGTKRVPELRQPSRYKPRQGLEVTKCTFESENDRSTLLCRSGSRSHLQCSSTFKGGASVIIILA